MNRLTFFFLVCFALSNPGAFAQTFTYPSTPKQPVSDTIFGKVVVDDYRWMEDINNPKVQDWLKVQANLTDSILEKLPGRNKLIEEYKKLGQSTTANLSPFILREGGRYFYTKTLAGENVAKLYYRQGKEGKEVLLFDPASYSKGGGKTTFRFLPSKDGKKVALALTDGGRFDINTVKVLNVDTKTFFSDSLYPVYAIPEWSPNSKGFLYVSLPTDDQHSLDLFKDNVVRYHELGADPKEDKLILSRVINPELGITPSGLPVISLSPDEKYLTITTPTGNYYALAADMGQKDVQWKRFTKSEERISNGFIYKERVYFVSDGRIMMSPLHSFDAAKAKILIPRTDKSVEWLKVSRDYLFVVKTDGVNTSTVQYHLATGKLDTIQPPFSGNAWISPFDAKTNDCIINVTSWIRPRTRYDYEPLTRKWTLSTFNTNPLYPGMEDLVAEEVEVKSHDGVMVPLSIIYNKNIKKDGSNVVFMTGYGAYGSYGIPIFNPTYLPLLSRGVIIAKTHVRGGGERGEAWHKGGFKATKPNTWKDFIASAEYLIDKGYTSAKQIIGEGFSAGGIMIGRAMTERPDLFAAAIHNVPLSNPLRGENRPNGAADAAEFGTVKDSTEAMGLLQMDTYLNVKQGVSYPAVLATAGINDTRIPVWQPGKLVAALQNASTSDKPALLLVNYHGGHITQDWIRDSANQFAFALWQAGHKDFQPVKD